MNICIVTPAFKFSGGAGYIRKLIKILEPSARDIFVITSGLPGESSSERVKIIPLRSHDSNRLLVKVLKYIFSQWHISWKLMRVSRRVDVVIFEFGSSLLLPMVTAKLCRKKTILMLTGSSPESLTRVYRKRGGALFSFMARCVAKVNYSLADRISFAMESPTFVGYLGLEKHRAKIALLGEAFIDTDLFAPREPVAKRGKVIGYAGRLGREKGVMELAKAIPLVLARVPDVRFLIVGDGPLMSEMKGELAGSGSLDKVTFAGWAPYEKMPDYLNQMRIHVLPSHTEAFGGTGLEAMACGTISIVNSVGGLPDTVEEGQTGFLLRDNSPNTIADKLVEVLQRSDLERIGTNAREFVEKNLAYDKVVERWARTLADLQRRDKGGLK